MEKKSIEIILKTYKKIILLNIVVLSYQYHTSAYSTKGLSINPSVQNFSDGADK